jgi:tetratricopeptide (TPR) repeat protein
VSLAALAELESDLPALRGSVEYYLASLAEDRGDFREATTRAEVSLTLRQEQGDASPITETLNLLGKLAINRDDAPAARHYLGEGLRLLGEQNPVIKGKLLHNLAVLAAYQGEVENARRLYREGLAELRRVDDPHDEARLLGDFGALAQQHDRDYAEARRLYLDALAGYHQLRDRHGIAVMLNNLGELAELDGQPETAVGLFLHAEAIFRELHSAFVTEPATSLARIAQQLGSEPWARLREAAEGITWEELLRAAGAAGSP